MQTRAFRDNSSVAAVLAFAPDGKLFAAPSSKNLWLWETDSGQEALRLPQRLVNCNCLAFSPDGKLLAVGTDRISLCQVASGKEMPLDDDKAVEIKCVAFAPDGKLLATGGEDAYLRVWDADTGAPVRRFKACPDGNPFVRFTPDGKSLWSKGYIYSRELFQWDLATGREQRHCRPKKPTPAIALSPSGRLLALSQHKTLRIQDAASGKELHAWPYARLFTIKIQFSLGEEKLAVFDCGAPPEIWELATGKRWVVTDFFGENREFIGLSPNGHVVASVDRKGRIHFQTIETAKEVACTKVDALAAGKSSILADFSPDGKTLAITSEFDAPIRLWETATGKERLRLPLDQGGNRQVSFSPDGRKLVSVSEVNNAVVWQVFGRAPGQTPSALPERQLQILWTDLASADGKTAFQALRTLSAAAPVPVVDFLRCELCRVPSPDTQRQITHWIAELDADRFDARNKAWQELAKLGDFVEPWLRKALQARPSLEQRMRLQRLLSRLDPSVANEAARLGRAVEVLEHLAASEARKVLKTLAEGEPTARLTQEARASLQRLNRLRTERKTGNRQ